ncbi:cytosolic aminopeptidase family protein [Klebsormidium nitens]|uniref:Cytosolic aminopeptidase family protein n=1 Tax=Klebsormidium nitens TaxID=105231 RepID=A0A1Y1IAW2_KLENI|nr:cytosolic aminopeptidase family protein [Klebsormidium nitens]|eukprot:GAQ85857.1 cytosolic aminopeptidase family protein [Klebsormidium nitens]
MASGVIGLTKTGPANLPELDIKVSGTTPAEWSGDALVVGVFEEALAIEGDAFKAAELSALDKSLGGALRELVSDGDFKGKPGQTSFSRIAGSKVKRVGLVGLGKQSPGAAAPASPWKKLGLTAAAAVKKQQVTSLAVAVIGVDALPEAARAAAVEGVALGVQLGGYEDVRFKSEAKVPALRSVALLSFGSGAEQEQALALAAHVTAGVTLARQLVAAPANVLTPAALAEAAAGVAREFSDVLSIQVLDQKQIEAAGMGAFLGVAAASDSPPLFIHLKYTPKGEPKRKLVIIGKGITHDTGGYNLKVGASIESMKCDMGGAAAAFGAARAIGAIKPPGVEVHFLSAACDNMISGHGMHPGDIITASNGKTIEVGNTDAEGRLTLADALVYACKLKPDAVVDLATLTGAIMVALGTAMAGLFANSDGLADQLATAARAAGEKLWRLPLEEEYKETIKSPIADLINTAGRPAGAIKAALFLQEFVGENVEWAHLDIAGVAYDGDKKIGTGFGVSTLVKWVLSQQPPVDLVSF